MSLTGRFELGIGAGHAHTEYAAIGAAFDPPRVRKERMAEAIEIVRRLLDGEEVTHHGAHYTIDGVRTMRSRQDHLPIFVGVNGRTALAHAARHADIIGLTMLGKTLPDGNQHEVRWQSARLDATDRPHRRREPWPDARVERSRPTPRRHRRPGCGGRRDRRRRRRSLDLEDALETPFLLLGTHDEIAAQIIAARDRWGVSYFTVRDLEAFAPVIDTAHAAAAKG